MKLKQLNSIYLTLVIFLFSFIYCGNRSHTLEMLYKFNIKNLLKKEKNLLDHNFFNKYIKSALINQLSDNKIYENLSSKNKTDDSNYISCNNLKENYKIIYSDIKKEWDFSDQDNLRDLKNNNHFRNYENNHNKTFILILKIYMGYSNHNKYLPIHFDHNATILERIRKCLANIEGNILMLIKNETLKLFPKSEIYLEKIKNSEYENKDNSSLHKPPNCKKLSFLSMLNNERMLSVRNAQNSFLKHFDIYKVQDHLLKDYLSVKYKFWQNGMKGDSIKIGLLDSGIYNTKINCNLVESINFTNETNQDFTGHGTFLASILCAKDIGLAPNVSLYSLKIFNRKQKTFTSWLLQALDYSLANKLDIINLSFGGINFDDKIIKNKLYELSKKGIILIVSAGNDGPSLGTINFPGNLPFVITVGSTTEKIFSILNTSSRGPAAYSKFISLNKPNVWVPGENIIGNNIQGDLVIKRGSSVSTIIATSFISLILSNKNFDIVNNYKNTPNMKYNGNLSFKRKFLNVFNFLFYLRESNLPLPSISSGEITSGILNPDGLLNVILYEYENFMENAKSNYNKKFNEKKNLPFNLSIQNITKNNRSTDIDNFTNSSSMPDKEFKYYLINDKKNRIKLFNNLLDFSFIYHSNYTISAKNKIESKKYFYSSKQPEIIPIIFYDTDLHDSSSENITNFSTHIYENKTNHANFSLGNYSQNTSDNIIISNVDNDSDIYYSSEIDNIKIIKLVNEIKLLRSKRKTDIFQCLKIEFLDENFIYLKDNFIFTESFGILLLKIYISNNFKCSFINDEVEINIQFLNKIHNHPINLKITLDIISTPSRFNRILFDRYHNLIYPFDGLVIRDDLYNSAYNFDWTFETLNTNYFNLNCLLKRNGYYLEEAIVSLDYIDLQLYSLLLLSDSEKNLTNSEIESLRFHYENSNLSIFIITEWNNKNIIKYISNNLENDADDNTSKNAKIINGAEILSINKFLGHYGFEIGEDSLSYEFYFNKQNLKIKSGNSIKRFPAKGYLFGNSMRNDLYSLFNDQKKNSYRAVLGLYDKIEELDNSGRIAIFTDSYCIDDYQLGLNFSNNCFSLVESIIRFLIHGKFAKNDLDLDYQNILIHDFISLDTKNEIKSEQSNNSITNQLGKQKSFNPENNKSSPDEKELIDGLFDYNYTDHNVISSIFYENFNSRNYQKVPTDEKTTLIPNLLYRKNKIKETNEEKDLNPNDKLNSIYLMFKDILYILFPLIIFIFFIFTIIKCKRKKFHIRRNNISVREEVCDINMNHNPSMADIFGSNIRNQTYFVSKKPINKYINLTDLDTNDNTLVDEQSRMMRNETSFTNDDIV